jgi:hypothetical protein
VFKQLDAIPKSIEIDMERQLPFNPSLGPSVHLDSELRKYESASIATTSTSKQHILPPLNMKIKAKDRMAMVARNASV